MLHAGDIGGPKTNLAIFLPEDGPLSPLAEATYPSSRYTSLEILLCEFLAQVGLGKERTRNFFRCNRRRYWRDHRDEYPAWPNTHILTIVPFPEESLLESGVSIDYPLTDTNCCADRAVDEYAPDEFAEKHGLPFLP
jgi:hypothetical protein